jgi:cysteine desulfurase
LRIYFDYNATSPLRPEVQAEVAPLLFGETFGNASSIHWAGQAARRHLESARARIAALTGRGPSEVIFTSGGSEADNLAVLGVLQAAGAPRRLIVSAVEHPAVKNAAAEAEARGVERIEIGVDPEGRLDLDALDRALAGGPALVSVLAVNNETGVISPLDQVIERAHAAGSWVHADAVQAAGRIPLPLGADLITLSAHKLGGPKGVGALLIKKGLPIAPRIVGGPQERGLRAGTEPVALAVGMAAALELALAQREREMARLGALVARLEAAIEALPGTRVLGRGAPRVAQTSTTLFEGVEAETLLLALDLEGVAASSGSACSSGSLEPSHVLIAMGVPGDRALGAVRFSLGFASSEGEITRLIELLPPVLARVRGR